MARLDLRGIIGQGTFSRVDLVKDTWTSEFFALKTYSKEQVKHGISSFWIH